MGVWLLCWCARPGAVWLWWRRASGVRALPPAWSGCGGAGADAAAGGRSRRRREGDALRNDTGVEGGGAGAGGCHSVAPHPVDERPGAGAEPSRRDAPLPSCGRGIYPTAAHPPPGWVATANSSGGGRPRPRPLLAVPTRAGEPDAPAGKSLPVDLACRPAATGSGRAIPSPTADSAAVATATATAAAVRHGLKGGGAGWGGGMDRRAGDFDRPPPPYVHLPLSTLSLRVPRPPPPSVCHPPLSAALELRGGRAGGVSPGDGWGSGRLVVGRRPSGEAGGGRGVWATPTGRPHAALLAASCRLAAARRQQGWMVLASGRPAWGSRFPSVPSDSHQRRVGAPGGGHPGAFCAPPPR